MAWSFRKSVSLGKNTRLNLSKGGIGMSTGVKGLRMGANSRGVYSSTSIPGTGLRSINYSPSGGKSSKSTYSTSNNSQNVSLTGCIQVIVAFIALSLIISVPIIGVPLAIGGGIYYYKWSKKPKQVAKRQLEKARKLFMEEKYEESIILLKDATELDPENNDVVRTLGGALHNSKQFKESTKYLELALQNNPDDINSKLALGNSYYQTKKYDEAIKISQEMHKEFPEDLQVIQILGASFAGKKKYDLAIDAFKKAPLLKRNLDDQLMELHYNLAVIYEESGDKKNALKHFKKVYSRDMSYKDVSDKVEKLA